MPRPPSPTWSVHRHPTWGQWRKYLCWIVGPSIFDVGIPDDHAVEYRFTIAGEQGPGRPPKVVFKTIDVERAARFYRINMARGLPLSFHTVWIGPDGARVDKFKAIRDRKAQEPPPPKRPRGRPRKINVNKGDW